MPFYCHNRHRGKSETNSNRLYDKLPPEAKNGPFSLKFIDL